MKAKIFRLTGEDVKRLDQLIERISRETDQLGMKKIKQSTMLRALIFCGENISDENLIEAIKKAYSFA